MADFINTIDVLGDGAVFDSIIKRTITEFKDNKVTKVRHSAFCYCSALATVEVPEATSIGDNAFKDCKLLSTVNAPKVTEVLSNAFYNCDALTAVSFPLVTKLNASAFYGCDKLGSASFPLVTSLLGGTFRDCSSLKNIEFPALNSTDGNVFHTCTALQIADFPVLTKITGSLFEQCSSLIALVLRSETVCTLSTTAFNGTPVASGTGYIYVPSALIEQYRTASGWSTYANQFRKLEEWTVDGTVTGELDIENRHMVRFFDEDGTLLSYVIVPTGSDAVYSGDEPVKEGDYAFTGFAPDGTNITADTDCYAQFKFTKSYTRSLVDRTITSYESETLQTVGDGAFEGCGSLVSVNVPNVTEIITNAFYECTALENVNMPNVITINSYCFYKSNIYDITLPNLEILGSNVFANCKKLHLVDLPKVKSLGMFVFSNTNLNVHVILRSSEMCEMKGSVGINTVTYFYVPRALVEDYKIATNFAEYADRIFALEDYTVDGTITGKFDTTKI